MNGREQQARLQRMADMVFDERSARLRAAAERRDALRLQIDDLNHAPPAEAADPAIAPFFFAYETWAAARRAEVNMQLAVAQADWLSRLDDVRQAFGRREVLERIARARK